MTMASVSPRAMSTKQSPTPSAYTRALALLSRREHSQRELESKLAARGHDEAEIEAALARLSESGFQSEARFAELLARSRIAQGHGPIRILAELRQHGIADDQAQAALDTEAPDWPALAAELCRRRFRGPAGSHGERIRRANFLARRGFPGSIARNAVDAAIDPD